MGKRRKTVRRRRRIKLPEVGVVELWVQIGFAVLITLMPIMLGTTPSRPSPILISRVMIVLLFWIFMFSRRNNPKFETTGLWMVALGASIFTLLQILPLPPFAIALLSPEADRIFNLSLESLGLYGQGQWRPLSLDPAETWHAAAGFFSLLMVYLVAANLFGHRHSTERTVMLLAGCGFLIAIIGFVQKTLGLNAIFGFFPFKADVPFFFSTFVNSNHLACFLAMTVPLQMYLALKDEDVQRRIFFMLMALVTSTAIFMSLSRGGMIAFLSSQLLLGYMLWRKRNKRMDLLWIQVLLAVVFVFSALLALHEIADEFNFSELSPDGSTSALAKPVVWKDALDMSADFPLTGIGAEAFKVAYPIYKTTRVDKKFNYPENIVVQTVVESGIPVASFLIMAVLVTFILIFGRKHLKRVEIAYFCALFAVIIHNYVDFNLSVFSIAVPFVILLAILSMRIGKQTSKRWFLTISMSRRAMMFFAILSTLVVAGGEYFWMTKRLPLAQGRMHHAAYDRTLSEEKFRNAMNRELADHPADYYLRILASEHYRNGSFSDMPQKLLHLRKAGMLNPTEPMVDRLIGRSYGALRDTERAKESFRRSIQKTELAADLENDWLEMLHAGLSAKDLVELTPLTGIRVRDLAEFLVDFGALDQARILLTRWEKASGSQAPDLLYLVAKLSLKRGLLEEVDDIAELLINRHDNSHFGYLLKGEMEAVSGRYEDALPWLEKAEGIDKLSLPMLHAKARILSHLGRYREAKSVANHVHALSWKIVGRKAAAYLLSGEIEERKGNSYEAQREYERARVYEPENGTIFFKIGHLYEKRGEKDKALKYYRKAESLGADVRALASSINGVEKFSCESTD